MNGPKLKETEEVETAPNSVSVVPGKRKTVKTVKHTTETMAQVNTPIPSPQHQTPVTPIQPYPGPYATYYPTIGQRPVMQNLSGMSPSNTPDFQQTILDKLNRLETRLNTLDSIENHLSTLSKKMTLTFYHDILFYLQMT